MVIGNGLIAKSFSKFEDDDRFLIFASGVSNSQEKNNFNFEREFDLIKSFTDTNKKFVYFSTSNFGKSDYFQHKRKMEIFISDNFKKSLIFRIPNIVGIGGNQNNLFNLLRNKISKNEIVDVFDTYRSLIDIDDLKNIIDSLIEDEIGFINLCYIERIKVIEIVNIMKILLNNDELIINIKKDQVIDMIENSTSIDRYIKENIPTKNYTYKLIKKYINK
jgi:nucleoside-diphosphate-sugar epimerase